MAFNKRKQAVCYSVLIPSIWWHNLGFGEPIQSYSSFSNEPKTAIFRVVETYRVNSISRGGDLGKSGPGPRAKADALKNARKTGGGSIVYLHRVLFQSDNIAHVRSINPYLVKIM